MIELLEQLDLFDGVDDETLQEFASQGLRGASGGG